VLHVGVFGQLRAAQALLVAGGVGAERAARAAESILQAWKPDLLTIAGVAGALSPSLKVGDVVIANAVYTAGDPLRPSVIPAALHRPTQTGPLLCLDRVLVTAGEKHAAFAPPEHPTPNTQHPTLNTQHPTPPLAVEMETAAAARVAEAHGVPWAAVRAISDTAGESLPLDFNRLRDADGDLRTSRVALAALARPGSIPGLLRLGRNTGIAAEALACFLDHWLATIGTGGPALPSG
jgi:adenosylhomocysteine nucleosidase